MDTLRSSLLQPLFTFFPDLFGQTAQGNGLKTLLDKCMIDPTINVEQGKSGYLVDVRIKSPLLKKMGFPSECVEIQLDKFTDSASSLTITSGAKDSYMFLLQWNSIFDKTRKKRNTITTENMHIGYELYSPIKKNILYKFNEKEDKKLIGFKENWSYKDLKLTFSFEIHRNMMHLRVKPSVFTIKRNKTTSIDLQFPLYISFSL